MNNCYESVSANPPPPPALNSPPPILEWGALLTVIVGGVGYLGRWMLEQTATKEKAESDLMKSLVQHLQHILDLLIADAKESKAEIIRHIDLKDSVTKLTTQVDEKVNRALSGQSELYIESLRNQTKIIQGIEALHKRGDEVEIVVAKLLEMNRNDSSG